jgi:hypothetical protein
VYATEVGDVLFPNSDRVQVEGYEIPLVPLAHELIFNLLRERKDRAYVAGALIHQQPDKHLPLLQTLLDRNRLSPDVAAEAFSMTQTHSNDRVTVREESL